MSDWKHFANEMTVVSHCANSSSSVLLITSCSSCCSLCISVVYKSLDYFSAHFSVCGVDS